MALPAIYQADDFTCRWLAGFDEVIAPILSDLDNLDVYLDPGVAPEDFVAWLGGWLGLGVEESWSPEALRRIVQMATEVFRWRGTVRGLAAYVSAYAGVEPEIIDSGGSAWSRVPGGPAPGDGACTVTVRLPSGGIDLDRLDRLIAAAKPAHIAHRVETR
jgi:phage tail-like protein